MTPLTLAPAAPTLPTEGDDELLRRVFSLSFLVLRKHLALPRQVQWAEEYVLDKIRSIAYAEDCEPRENGATFRWVDPKDRKTWIDGQQPVDIPRDMKEVHVELVTDDLYPNVGGEE